MLKRVFIIVYFVIVISGCNSNSITVSESALKISENVSILSVNFEWTKQSGCSGISPPIIVSNIPQETKYLRVKMVDLDFLVYNHGGGEVSYNGSTTIKEGALVSYYGPCPPHGVTHEYEITVQALSADKQIVIGHGKAVRKYQGGLM
jgi:phosphatidylethanolamine-binding protein (PEBP) family uncharacterized protein